MEPLRDIRNLLACPACKEPNISADPKGFSCPTCHHHYPVLSIGEDSTIDFVPDADAKFQNPVQKLWQYLLGTSSEFEEYVFLHGMTLENMDVMHSMFHVDGEKVLDIGGGSGYLRRYLKPGQLYVDLEPDPAALPRRALFAHLDENLVKPFVFVRGVAEYVPFRAASFDAIYMGGMIEHVFDINFTFSEASRVLKPGGHLYIFAGCGGYTVKTSRRSAWSKLSSYVKSHGLAATIRRIRQKSKYAIQRKLNPWKHIMDFTHTQTESGHIYDDLRESDIIELASRYGLMLSKSMHVPETGDTIFIFAK